MLCLTRGEVLGVMTNLMRDLMSVRRINEKPFGEVSTHTCHTELCVTWSQEQSFFVRYVAALYVSVSAVVFASVVVLVLESCIVAFLLSNFSGPVIELPWLLKNSWRA